ncbi:metallophosphoesterase [Kordiimonas aestuarii]|uniref:metallophosphoesterase n=1 Tax=Kordiimonas aestuarii TaxID=1005925 RepID=UPI0021D1A3AE|nr:metallophosphoesterase [Kordiimonas aestuarii]
MFKFKSMMATAGVALLAGAACAQTAPEPADEKTISFLAFGDSGYHYGYQKEKLWEKPFRTLEAIEADERADWMGDNKNPSEFQMPSLYFHPEMGGYIMRSGQQPVADAMKAYCEVKSCEFGVMLGDNIYPDGATLGADGIDDDKRFEDIFTIPYKGLGAGEGDFRIYTALGNHDWHTSREGAMAQVDYMEKSDQFYMDGIFYSVKPPSAGGEVEIFVIDTEVILSGVGYPEAKLNPDGSEMKGTGPDDIDPWAEPANEAERNMVPWLENALKNSTAKWKFVVAHHPLWSTGGSKFEQARALRQLLLPMLCDYADAYFAGHEHSLEIHTDTCETTPKGKREKPLLHVLSGAASKERSTHHRFADYQAKAYPQQTAHFVRGMIWGFTHIELKGDKGVVRVISTPTDSSGAPYEEFEYWFENR